MYLINLSSNVNAKFYIGSALTRLNDMGDMYVSSMYATADRKGSQHDYYNCCIELHTSRSFDEVLTNTKSIEASLGRGTVTVNAHQVVIDIDILATQTDGEWQFDDDRLPLTDGECWALQELEMPLPQQAVSQPPVFADWQL